MLVRAHTCVLTNLLLETDKSKRKERKQNANTGKLIKVLTFHPEQDFEHRLQLLRNWEEPQGFVQKISYQAS